MVNITKITESYITEHPFVKDCLKKGLINYSSLTRQICLDLELDTTKHFDAVLIACRRYFNKIKSEETTEKKILEILQKTKISVEFKAGIPVKVKKLTAKKTVSGSLKLFSYLNELGSKNGIGRMDLVENRFVGMKSRGVYETPAGTILLKAHLDIEGLVLDKEVSHLKDMFMPKIAELIYNGFWFSPEMEFLMASVNKSQEHVDGTVYITLYKGNVMVTGRESKKSLYSKDIASMDKLGNYDQEDAKGFININALRLKLGGKK